MVALVVVVLVVEVVVVEVEVVVEEIEVVVVVVVVEVVVVVAIGEFLSFLTQVVGVVYTIAVHPIGRDVEHGRPRAQAPGAPTM